MVLLRKSILLASAAVLFATGAIAQKPAAPKSIRLYIFDGGTIETTDPSPYRLKKEDVATTNMSIPCFLVVHPKGILMWDACAIPDSAFAGGAGSAKVRNATATKPFGAQLAALGYKPSDVTYLAFSHYHWDHVGNGNLFASSTWLVPQSERDLMFSSPPNPRTEPQNYSALKDAKTTILTKDEFDVFGDGKVVIMAAPGHSPGHQVLFLKLAKTGPVMLSGDLYHYPEERQRSLVPISEFNAEQTAASRAKIEAFLKKNKTPLWIQHDFTANAKLKKAPQYYE